jgi:uncharacterized protein (TIGR03382 family)
MKRTIVLVSLLVTATATAIASAAPPPPVVGGTRVKVGEFPDVVAVVGSKGLCSGTLIAPDVVLTAGHCIDVDPKLVIVNTTNIRDADAGDRIAVKWARSYPSWETSYDVSVIMLEHVAQPHPRAIATACLANRLLGDRKPVTVVGFGLTSPSGTDDNTMLHKATLPILDPTCTSDPTCEPDLAPNGEFTAGGRGTDSCFGDSGGPVMLTTSSGLALAGVVSRGLALPGAPCGNGGVYVRADKVVAWIERVTGRKLDRAGCSGQPDDPGATSDGPEDDGGCNAGGGTACLPLLALAIAAVFRRRATSSGAGRPDPRGPVVRAEAGPARVGTAGGTAGGAAAASPVAVVDLAAAVTGAGCAGRDA